MQFRIVFPFGMNVECRYSASLRVCSIIAIRWSDNRHANYGPPIEVAFERPLGKFQSARIVDRRQIRVGTDIVGQTVVRFRPEDVRPVTLREIFFSASSRAP